MDNDNLMVDAETVESWVISKVNAWESSFKVNYQEKFEEYNRLWRGIWAESDKTRASERSRLISPALQQAVESSVAEIEEATFGRGAFFTIRDDMKVPEGEPKTEQEKKIFEQIRQKVQQEKLKIEYLTKKLNQDFSKAQIRKSIGEVLINSAVTGTGIAEIVIDTVPDLVPTEVVDSQGMGNQGVSRGERVLITMQPVLAQNFRIDPLATSIEESIGVAIDYFVSPHSIEILQEKGIYRDVDFGTNAAENELLDTDPNLTEQPENKVRLTKYFGLVPRHLYNDFIKSTEEDMSDFGDELDEELENEEKYKEPSDLEEALGIAVEEKSNESFYIEAMVILVNGDTVLKCEENKMYFRDRPIIAFPWDIVPGRFWGRGVCEKGCSSQKALDTEMRARIDALALTNAPMMACDSTRLSKGANTNIRPGGTILTNGDPREVLVPFKFGEISSSSFVQTEALQRMVQTATGAIDSAGVPGSINGEATAAGISMGLSAIIKRHKRTLVNFQQSFLIPFVKKSACRYMQFSPEKYPVKDYDFEVTSSLGIVAREYEVTQLVQLLQTMGADTPVYPLLVKAIIENMQVSNREELIKLIDESQKPNPEAEKLQKDKLNSDLGLTNAQTQALIGTARESQARAEKLTAEAEAIPAELRNETVKAISAVRKVDNELDRDDKKVLGMSKTMLEEEKLNLKREEIFNKQ